jgi:hypothetical protein
MMQFKFNLSAFLPIGVGLIFIFDLLYVSYVINNPVSRFPTYFICSAICFFIIFKNDFKIFLGEKSYIFILLFSMAILNVLISYIRFESLINDSVFLAKIYAAILIPIFYMLFGMVLSKFHEEMYFGFFVVLLVIFFGSFYINYLNINLSGIFIPALYRHEDDYLFDMHYFADYILILSLIFVGLKRKMANIFFILALSICIMLGSRTPFIFGIIAFFSTKMIVWSKNLWFIKKSTFFLFFILLIILFYILFADGSHEVDLLSRFSSFDRVLMDFDGRFNIFNKSLTYVDGCILLGCFPFENIFFDSDGMYSHNWMSFFFSFGMFVFVIFIVMVMFALIKAFSSYKNIEVLLPVYLFFLLCIVFSRSYVWPFWSLILGYIYFIDIEKLKAKNNLIDAAKK